jgi:hypothetical protein
MACNKAFTTSMASTVLPFFHRVAEMRIAVTIAISKIAKNEG